MGKKSIREKFLLSFFIAMMGVFPLAAHGASIEVDSNGNTVSDDGFCTLKEAVDSANNDSSPGTVGGECEDGDGADDITFNGVTGTITLAGGLQISESLTITGPGSDQLALDGNQSSRVIFFNSTTDDQIFTLANLKITGGKSNGSAGGIFLADGETLNLLNSEISGNEANGAGGNGAGISTGNYASLVILHSTISGNYADNNGGGIAVNFNSALIMHNSTVSNNNAGVVYPSASGGGILCGACSTMDITNSTFSGNQTSGWGGGLYMLGGVVTLSNATIYNNTADQNTDASGSGGGLDNNAGTLNFKNTILAGNTDNGNGAPDCDGILNSLDFNLIQDATGCTINGDTDHNITGEDPLLGALANNGGFTQSHALLIGSPAIDAGDDTGCTDENDTLLIEDQRGFLRPVDGDDDAVVLCDIGAFELGICGDGNVNANSGEECDDGNKEDGDGCSSSCVEETLEQGGSQGDNEINNEPLGDPNSPLVPASQIESAGCAFHPGAEASWVSLVFFLALLSGLGIFRKKNRS